MHITKPHGLFVFLFLLVGCSQESSQTPNALDAVEPIQLVTDGFYQSAEESVLKLPEVSRTFTNSVLAFMAQPDQNRLQSCREAWLLLHKAFIDLDFYFYDALRSDQYRALVFNIHAWPLQPGFIDSLPEYPTSGFVNDLTVEISKTTLIQQHAATSPDEISLGLHAVEYLLWQRPLTDFQPVSELPEQQIMDGLVLQQLANNRRRLALQLISDILGEELISLQSLLAGELKLNRNLVVNDPLNAIQKALESSGNELNQMTSEEQQDHSEFSQSSLQNILSKFQLILKSYSGDTNLNATLQSRNQQLATEFQQALDATLQEIESLGSDDSDSITRLATLVSLLDHHIEEIIALRGRL